MNFRLRISALYTSIFTFKVSPTHIFYKLPRNSKTHLSKYLNIESIMVEQIVYLSNIGITQKKLIENVLKRTPCINLHSVTATASYIIYYLTLAT